MFAADAVELYGISIDFGLEVIGRKSTCGTTVNLETHLFSHDAKAPNSLIVTRDTSFFKTYCYLIASLESSMSLASGYAEASAAKRLRSSRFMATSRLSNREPSRGGSNRDAECRHFPARSDVAQNTRFTAPSLSTSPTSSKRFHKGERLRRSRSFSLAYWTGART